MVYNAMKLFMEINPQLFDDCSHDYTEHQNSAEERKASRNSRWERLESQAKKMQSGQAASTDRPGGASRKVAIPPRVDEDPMTQDSQKRLDALKLQDEAGTASKYGRDVEQQNSVSTRES